MHDSLYIMGPRRRARAAGWLAKRAGGSVQIVAAHRRALALAREVFLNSLKVAVQVSRCLYLGALYIIVILF